jgi:hypothetical protein
MLSVVEIAKQPPRATGLDWLPVLRVALDNAEKAGVRDAYTFAELSDRHRRGDLNT